MPFSMKLMNKGTSALRYGGLVVLLLLLTLTTACPKGDDLPANLSLSNLSIEPTEVEANQPVTISVTATNTGDSDGSFNIPLKIEDETEETKTVSIAADGSATVTFSVTRIQGSHYTVAIGSLRGSFNVQGVDFITDGIITEFDTPIRPVSVMIASSPSTGSATVPTSIWPCRQRPPAG